MLSEVPEGWRLNRLSSVATYTNGKAFKPSDWSSQGLPIIRIPQLRDPSSDYNCFSGTVDDKYRVTSGDLLFSWSATLTAVMWNAYDAVLNQHIFKVEPIDDINKEFLLYRLLLSIDELMKGAHGTTMQHIKKRELDTHLISVPPLPEQKRIAEILSSVDESIQATQSVIDQAERVKRGLMEDLLTGGLGSEAIARGEVPEGWRMIPFADFCEIKAGVGFPVKFQGRTEGDFPFYKVSDMNSSGNEQFMSVANHYVTEADLPVLKAKPYPDGAVIFPKIGAAIRTNKKRRLTKDSLIDNNVMALIANDNVVTPGYLFRIMERTNIYSFSSQNGLPSINKSTIAKAEALIPPLCEQKRIAEILSGVDVFIQSQKQIIDQYQVTKKGLMDDLLTGKVRTV
ncbi:hypothetical protein GH984_03275 [Spiribacter sp. C176]|uniref:Type I restriction modification DNA specificity domain-containing protein n=1 Tax=Spiribacter salilacus TaxID=2664894 RepID=A0A6N7QTR5_9GAMM|nr:restriction endonuclease subunit S [Spiribacter salilacus]MRH77717.1 hypothetical protein [Spiribacter salilacus]